MRTPLISTGIRAVMLLVLALSNLSLFSQYSCEGWSGENAPGGPYIIKWNPLRQRVVENQTVPGTGLIRNWLEFLPDDYHSSSKKYPVMIFFHGVNEGGGGSPCRLLQGEWWWTPPVIIERRQFPYSSKDQNGAPFKFIVISPRMEYFGETSNTINSFIDHLIRTYRIDPSRVYLTGISAGANFILQYAGLSESNSKKVAGIMPVAMCDVVNADQARNISRGGLHVYSVKCSEDVSCGPSNAAAANTNAINAINPGANLAVHATLPLPNWPCNNGLKHDAWGTAYDSLFKVNLNGRNINAYEYLLQFRSAANGPLPVDLESYGVQLSNGKVYVRWSTTTEENSGQFSVDRAGNSQQFTSMATIAAAGNSGTLKTYEWIDENPLPGLSYYRLTQTDRDGAQQIFQVRKILNQQQGNRTAIVSPNPFGEELTVFMNVDKIQKVGFTLVDMSGRVIKTMNAVYNEGTAEVKIDATKLQRGVYFLKIEGEFFTETQRVVKQ
jgi:predicted esterase